MADSKPVLPPSLSRIRSAPAPGETEEDRLCRERWNYHIDRMNELEEKWRQHEHADRRAFLRLVEELSPGTLTRNANEVAEAMFAEDDAAARSVAAPRGRGRPRTRQKQLRIMGTVEAYI